MKDRNLAFIGISIFAAVAFICGFTLGARIAVRAEAQIASLQEPAGPSPNLAGIEARAESALNEVMALDGAVVLASYYGYESGKVTANSEHYNPEGYTAAHRTLPFNTFIVAENLDNGRSAVIRINDRGPAGRLHRRGIDVSLGVARELGMLERGLAPLKLRVIGKPGAMVAGRPSTQD